MQQCPEQLGRWSYGVTFNNLTSLEGQPPRIKVVLRNSVTGIIFDSQEIETSQYAILVPDTQLDVNGN